MAAYQEQSVSDRVFGPLPFIGAIAAQQVGKTATVAPGLTARAFGRTGAHGLTRSYAAYMAGSERLAARRIGARFAQRGGGILASRFGVFSGAGAKAATRAGLTSQFAKVALSRAAGLYFTAFNIAFFAPLLYSGAKGVVNTVREIGRRTGRLEFGGDFQDTRGAYTERQRALRAITSSRMSTRAALGGEAQLMHR
jgi:hypothetical protein